MARVNKYKETIKKETLEMFRKGYSRRRIVDEIVAKYGYGERNAYRITNEIFKELAELNEIDPETIRDAYRERLEYILESAIAKKDFNLALRTQDILNKLNGMYVENHKVDLNVTNMEFKFGDE